MTRTLRARGPDDEGYYVGEGCGLGHRRLSIIDIGGGRQPLAAADGAVQSVVNGELYNFRALRRRLEGYGHRFVTESDSEVLGHGFAQWGAGIVSRREGMFAFALWDARDRTLWLGRDRMGQKPLYFARHERGLLFGSELKALLAHPTFRPDLSTTGLATYLVHECYPEEQCVFEGVSKVRPGELVRYRVEDDELENFTYWQPTFGRAAAVASVYGLSETALVDRLAELLLASVDRRLVSDVPLGVFLSGGVDSSVVAAAMTRLREPSTVETFSIGFSESSFDESPFAQRVADHLGTTHRMERLSAQTMLDVLPEVADYMDEPLGDASIIPTYLLSAFTRKHVTVALGGDGGDELFLGYPTFRAELVARRFDGSLLRPAGRATGRLLNETARLLPVSRGYFSLDFKLKRLALGLGHSRLARHQRWMSSFLPESLVPVLGPLNVGEAELRAVREMLERSSNLPGSSDGFDELTRHYLRLYLAGDVLVKVDRASMAHGLEVRAPFLDRELVEMALVVPWRHKLKHGQTKWLLKRLAERWLPPDIVHRSKRGFAVPIADWLRGPLRDWAHDLLAPRRLANQGVFDHDYVARLLAEHQAGRADHRKPLWTLLAFQMWFDRYGPRALKRAA